MILATARLRLRPWRESDLAPFAAMNADARVMEHLLRTLDPRRERRDGRARQEGIAQPGLEPVGGRGRRRGRFVGFAGLAVPAWQAHFTPCVEVGWRLAREAWGHGYATEAARAAIGHGLGAAGLAEIVSFTALVNTRSIAVMERLGMRRDGEFDHPLVAEGHRLRRHVLYRIGRGRPPS